MNRGQLLKNEGYWTSKIQIDLYNQLEKYMSDNKINRSQLAKKLKVSKGYVTQILNGDFNHRISKLVELALAIDKIPEINYRDLNQTIKETKEGFTTISWQVAIKDNSQSISNLNNHSAKQEDILPEGIAASIERNFPLAS
jgi:transcriptional regulator with XRE-family HTH domain